MDIWWQITHSDSEKVAHLVHQQSNTRLLKFRKSRNLKYPKSPITKERFWRAMVCMRLTTMQLTGPKSPVGLFASRRPFALAYDEMPRTPEKVERHISNTLKAARLTRFSTKIPSELSKNYRLLEDGEWKSTLNECNLLTDTKSTRETEIRVSDFIRERFVGFGPKQSRNLLQALGLTRFEIPIDSRLIKWLNEFGFPIQLSSGPLHDPAFYNFVSDSIQHLCSGADVMPCLFDGAVFSLSDKEDWDELAMSF